MGTVSHAGCRNSMARSRSGTVIGVGWGALLLGLAALAVECRRGPERAAIGRAAPVAPPPAAAPERANPVHPPPTRSAAARPVDSSSEPCMVSGLVLDGAGEPVADAEVRLDAEGDEEVVGGRTDQQGYFELSAP